MEIPIHGLMYRVDSGHDIAAITAKSDIKDPVISWPNEVLDEAKQHVGPEPRLLGFFQKTGIDVLIVGTGFAGLTAALECTRKGHTVRILERNSTTDLAGDAHHAACSFEHEG